MTDNIDNVLEERGKRYGAFTGHAEITQDLKFVMRSTSNWGLLDPDQAEALEMIAHKVGRILNGDPHYADSWTDIAGYARLVEQRLLTPVPEAPAPEAPSLIKPAETVTFTHQVNASMSPIKPAGWSESKGGLSKNMDRFKGVTA